jgi:hypothetical protein
MKLLAVAITAAFASGIAVGLDPTMETHAASGQLLLPYFSGCVHSRSRRRNTRRKESECARVS